MDTSASTASLPLDEHKRAVFLNLLGDDDPAVVLAVHAKLVSLGPDVCAWLRPHTLSSDAVVRRHARAVIQHFEGRDAEHDFLSFCLRHGEDIDLEAGALKLCCTTYPTTNCAAYSAVLDEFANELRDRTPSVASPRDELEIINTYLFKELRFRGNEENYFDPRNSYLSQVLDHRTGNPISLCTLYMLVARRLGLPIVGIGLPGHFLCRYQSSEGSIYIDPFHRGRLLTKADCVQYLLDSAFGLNEQFLAPVTTRRMLMRMCGNLHQCYLHLEQAANATRINGYLLALARDNT
ncbi:MAG: hypothetical protein RLY20_1735 [Verrucomicrobiota bacterium]|jgi:regulator of sirC expression with transglutaminase-like and TPR domain